MIIDLQKFIATERRYWDELAGIIKGLDNDPYRRFTYSQIRRLHYLYQRASADLAKISTFSAEQAVRDYLETLVSRAYAAIHATPEKPTRFKPLQWFWNTFPQAFRRRWTAFALSVAIFAGGGLFGGAALLLDPGAKAVLMPFEHLQMDPAERVAREERHGASGKDRLEGKKSSFSAFLMTHNTKVSILVLALGMSWGLGTVLLLFSNGVMLGAVAADYIQAGQSVFLFGWLLPHGAVEIPSVLLAGQAGLLLAGAMIGRGNDLPLAERLRGVRDDVVHLICGVAVLLIWAGIVEGFFSQYHEPVLPYTVKIGFGVIETGLLAAFLCYAGRKRAGGIRLRRKSDPEKGGLA